MTDEQLRAAFSEIPSDLPKHVPKHPGKPLSHRFVAEKSSDQLITPPVGGIKKLASELNFRPVTTMSIGDKNVHVKPVRNVRSRVIAPPNIGALQLLVRGEKVIDDSTEIQDKAQKRVDKKIKKFFSTSESNTPTKVASHLVERKPIKTVYTIEPAPPQNIASPKPNVDHMITPTTIKKTPPNTSSRPNLEQGAEPSVVQLKTEVNTLRNLLNQADVDKTVSQRRVTEITNKYQSQLATDIQEKTQINNQLTVLRNKLMEETKRRMASENLVVSSTTQLKTDINKMKIERDSQLGKLKVAQEKITLMQGQLAKATESIVIITQLKAKLAQIEKEKDEVDKKSIKLTALVSELQKKSNQPKKAIKLIIPKEEGRKSKDVPVKIIHPTPAIGKMAPQLTTVPNVVNGIIKNSDGLLLPDVVLVVKDSVGDSVRALKSNKIGQFAISTPLPDGVYTMELEKDSNEFDIVQINLEGKILLPIEIRAR